jgi:hypothetical protein
LDKFCTAYVNDILFFSKNPAEYRKYVTQVLEKLRLAGLQADIKKNEFSVTKTKFLGYIISINGIIVTVTARCAREPACLSCPFILVYIL